MEDGVDYVPAEAKFLAGQHFSAIAAAGPITGPILAGILFGWVPALVWIIIGSIFIGGVHDMGSLVASIRHKARSITEVVRQNVSRRAYILFMLFIWITLVYVIVAFTDITAGSFVGVDHPRERRQAAGRRHRHVLAALPGPAHRHGPPAEVTRRCRSGWPPPSSCPWWAWPSGSASTSP